MKKVLCMVLALMLCVGVCLAEATPSKTTQDLPKVDAVAENGRSVTIIIKEDNNSADQLRNLKATPVLDDYFGDIVKLEGGTAKLSELMEGDPDINEFASIFVSGYEPDFGAVTAKILFATPYATTDKVVVLIGLLDGTLTWYAFEGTVIDNQGTIQVVFPAEVMEKLQENSGFIAIASKSAAPADGASDGASAGSPGAPGEEEAPAEEPATELNPAEEAPADASAGSPGGEGN